MLFYSIEFVLFKFLLKEVKFMAGAMVRDVYAEFDLLIKERDLAKTRVNLKRNELILAQEEVEVIKTKIDVLLVEIRKREKLYKTIEELRRLEKEQLNKPR